MEKEEKNIIEKHIRLILFTITFWIFILIVHNIFKNDIYKFDDLVYKYISKPINPTLTKIFSVFTNVGSGFVMIPLCIIAFAVLKEKIEPIFISINFALAALINYILKNIFERQRPADYRLIHASGYSFPSGHSMVSMAFYGFIIYLIFKNVKNVKIKWLTSIALSILIILIGISRIYLGVHYASDVFGGFLLSIVYLTLYTKLYKTVYDKHQENKKAKIAEGIIEDR